MKLLLALFMLSLSLGCMHSQGKRFASLAQESYVLRINRLNDLLEGGLKDKTKISDVHLQLALLHSSYKNPKRDYGRSLVELEKYVALVPTSVNDYEIQNLLAMLKEVVKGKNKGRESKLLSENEKLNQKIDELGEDIKNLNETIEKLKQLDVELEKKRKSFK